MDKLLDDLMREVERWERAYRLIALRRDQATSPRGEITA